MTYHDLVQAAQIFIPALRLESMLPNSWRHFLTRLLGTLALISLMVGVFWWWQTGGDKILGVFLLLLAFWALIDIVNVFYNSYYFRDLSSSLREWNQPAIAPKISFAVAQLVFITDPNDLLAGFLNSALGRAWWRRLGLKITELSDFLSQRTQKISSGQVKEFAADYVGLTVYGLTLFQADKDLRDFLFTRGLQEKEVKGALRWQERLEEKNKRLARWWGREALGRIPGLAKDWAYGEAFELEKFGEELSAASLVTFTPDREEVLPELRQLETILSRQAGANALVVAEEITGALELIGHLAARIQSGFALPTIEHKRVMVIHGEALIASFPTKAALENEVIKLFNQASRAGNLILVIADLPAFLANLKMAGIEALNLLGPFLTANTLQLIGSCDTARFHTQLEPDTALMQHFEKVLMKNDEEEILLATLEDKALAIEDTAAVFFTYPAILTAKESAERYFPEATLPDKAVDLLLEIAARAATSGERFIVRATLEKLVAEKTKIPLGNISLAEKTKLLDLEKILHQRIIGQNEAVKMIADALLRARSGLANPNRPMGSFLFLGPTGVGKTETVKALAQTFFGDEKAIIRLDMSEYQAADALPKLIGEFGSPAPGVLSAKLREQPYGVLLLDEFEKSATNIRDLFLQVLDEGAFSDMSGKKINAHNVIIIATSNAGSDLIWQLAQRGEKIMSHRAEIIEEIIKRGIFKPELLNRFDGVILFHPLSEADLRQIAVLLLGRLQERLKVKGIVLALTEPLIAFLVKQGNDPKFGARPLNRAIQDKVERVIAEKIVRGSLVAGQTAELTEAELV